MNRLIWIFLVIYSLQVDAGPLAADSASKMQADSPQALEVCFSPVEPCEAKLAAFINSAKTSLDIAIFDINSEILVHSILVQHAKIPVRIVVDRRQSKGPHSLVGQLVKGGITVRYGKQRSIFHDKFTIVDGARIETGSFNYTNNAAKNNNENQVYLSSPEVVARYRLRFNEIWGEAHQK